MTRRILTTLALLALVAAISVGLLHAQGSAEAEQPPYRIDLLPGWNLISFPGDPVDTTLENVIGSDSQVDIILAYQGDAWLTALRNPNNDWYGTLTTISGDYGYWMYTPIAETIAAPLSPVTPPSRIPYCSTARGLYLVGVWDSEQRPAGTKLDAEEVFNQQRSLVRYYWAVAHGFDTRANKWETPIRRGSGATVAVGAGYWVWARGGAALSCP